MNKKYKHLVKSLSIGIVLVAMLFVCLEIFLRISGLGTPWNIDSHGCRRSLHSQQSFNYELCIVCVGNSFTFGMRLPQQDSYPSQLSEKIKNHLGENVDVRNAGISGHTSIQTFERLERDVIKYCPDLVVVWIGTNDGMLKNQADPRSNRPFDKPPILTNSVLLTTLDAWECIMPFASRMARPHGSVNDLTTRVNIEEFKKALSDIFSELKQAGITEIIAINIPRIPDHFMNSPIELVNYQRKVHSNYNRVIAEVAQYFSIPVIDVNFILGNKQERVFLQDGLHLTSYGYEIVAEAVLQEVMTIHQTDEKSVRRYYPRTFD